MHWLAMQNWKLSNNMAALYLVQGDASRALKYTTSAFSLMTNPAGVRHLGRKIQDELAEPASVV
ncbi:MAG: Flp pilus assembly protein TadD [Oleiphilaceae bacterium]